MIPKHTELIVPILKELSTKEIKKSSDLQMPLAKQFQLMEYIYEYGLGLQSEKVIKIMKMDTDFWETMDDDK